LRAVSLPRHPGEWLAIGAGLAVFGYVGWDQALWDARAQLTLHLIAIGAFVALGVVALRGDLPRTPLDLPVLGLLAAFALATVSALNVGMSLRAMAAITAFAAMLPVAILAIRHRPAWVGIVTSVPVLLLSVPTLFVLLSRRIDWIAAGAPGLPPIRLPSEGTPFGSVAVPPFVIIPAWALAGLIEPAWLRRTVRVGLVAVGIPMTILSGSRSAWLAIAVAAVVAVAPWAWRRRHRLTRPSRITPRALVAALAGAVAAVLLLILLLPRATALTSVLYRFALWRDTLTAWQSDPLLGIGPGFTPYARQAAAADFTFPVRQPHSHNLPLGVLGDAGLIGLGAALVVAGTLLLVAGPWRARTPIGRTAAIVLIGLGVGGLAEDLSFVPGYNLLAIALVAVALLDAGAVSWHRPHLGGPRRAVPLGLAGASTAAVLLAAMATADAGAMTYRAGIGSASAGRWEESATWLTRSVAIDPWHPAGPAALAVALDAAGDPDGSRGAAERATELNPGDGTAWMNLALECEKLGDATCQREAAERAAATGRYGPAELLNAALSLEAAGEHVAADRAFRLSLLSQPRTSFVVDWPRAVSIGDGAIPDFSDGSWQLNRLVALRAMGEPIDPAEFADDAVRALAHALIGERSEAEELVARAVERNPSEARTWDIAIVLRDAWGQPVEDELRIASVVRGRSFPAREAVPRVVTLSFDVATFRAYPRDGLVMAAVRTFTDPPYPWILAELLPDAPRP
jgi:O-antigen ligase/tetratricopeptide (TPR) repeat protein